MEVFQYKLELSDDKKCVIVEQPSFDENATDTIILSLDQIPLFMQQLSKIIKENKS